MPIKKVFVRAPYNYDTEEASLEAAIHEFEPTRTQQHQEEEANINTIVRRFGLTGTLPEVPVPPQYGDFMDNVVDYHSAQNMIRAADESFMALPADVRTRFDNDAGKFVDFCSNPDNLEEMRKLGLAVPKEKDPLDGSVVVPSTPSP